VEKLLVKYASKLAAQGLCAEDEVLMGGIDADLQWNRDDQRCDLLAEVISTLNISSILMARPSEPYLSILRLLAEDCHDDALRPEDSETRTFLHEIPVSRELSASAIVEALKKRKSVIIPEAGIITFGMVSPEQAFVTYSSVCFSLFVKFLTDLAAGRGGNKPRWVPVARKILDSYVNHLNNRPREVPEMKGPFTTGAEARKAMAEAGRLTVDSRLVDSYFGNISYRIGEVIHISQTGSSLDELEHCIDLCPLDDSSCAAITASSEFSAHREIYACAPVEAILHGHPKFCVIMSLLCRGRDTCPDREECFRSCPRPRFVGDIPIVPGEVGTGRYGLCHTLPPAIKEARGVIVYGHGLFTTGRRDFTDAYRNLMDIEVMCLDEYGRILGGLL
jgi:ribulose-5-phosphate 4-epimerase/fuculose-1-phosphate aldolase